MTEDNVQDDSIESTETLNQAESTETENQVASTETENQAENVDGSINQEAVNKKINKLTFEKHEERRKREDIEKTLADTQKKLEDLNASKDSLEIPGMPDIFDLEYDKKVKERDTLIQEKALKTAEAVQAKKQVETANKLQVEESNKEILKNVDKMFTKGKEYGISGDELKEADKTVSLFIRDPSLSKYILAHDESSLIVKYLASSGTELDSISRMGTAEAAVYIANNVLPNALKLKPGTSKAPDPLDVIEGGSGKSNKDSFLQGVQFE